MLFRRNTSPKGSFGRVGTSVSLLGSKRKNQKGNMIRSNFRWLFVLFLAPYLVGWTPADSSFNEYSIGVGGGQYASYDCAGNAHSHSFGDVGWKITHKYEAPIRVGLATTFVSNNINMIVVPYPDLAFDSKYFSLGTTGLRIGRENGTYGEISFLDQVPCFSGKGFFKIGMGLNASENTRLWLGVNSIPYRNKGLAGQIDFPLYTNYYLFINGRYGNLGGVPEYGFSIGTRIRFYEYSNNAK